MGLFDSWRRKRRQKIERKHIRSREILAPTTPAPSVAPREMAIAPEHEEEVVTLVAEYERLAKRRDELQKERTRLTLALDRGEISAIEFRRELMSRIQEAAQVADRLKEVAARLTALGYRGVLH